MSIPEFYSHIEAGLNAGEAPCWMVPWEQLGEKQREAWTCIIALLLNGGFGHVTRTGDKTRRGRKC